MDIFPWGGLLAEGKKAEILLYENLSEGGYQTLQRIFILILWIP